MTAATTLSAALLTPRGRGAIATIRICGDVSQLDQASEFFHAANRKRFSEQTVNRIVFGCWGNATPEDVVCCRCEESTWEIHCHGGRAAAERILQDLQRAGANVISWQELVALAVDTLEAELRDTLSQAVTWRTTEHLLYQLDGTLRTEFESLNQVRWEDSEKAATIKRLDELLQWSEFGRHLTEPWRVVIAGPANVGKSSLMNALLGFDRSIVFDQPGTTRDVLTASTAFDGWPVELIDTAGLRDASESLEAEGIARAKTSAANADLVLRVIDLSTEPQEIAVDSREILVAQKCDLPDRWQNRLPNSAFKVSVLTGTGLDELQRELTYKLVPQVPPLETPLPITGRQISLLQAMRDALAADRELDYRASAAGLFVAELLPPLPLSPRRRG